MNPMHRHEFRPSPVWAALLPILFAPQLLAQEETQAPAATGGIETIEVTARRNVESLQATPLSITALDTAAIEQKGIRTSVDLTGFVPTLQIQANAQASNDITLSMRGLRVSDSVATADSPIGVYLDGVIQPRISGALMDMLELERVEVLRGPQGSLYGRNSTGGAINFISKKPYYDFGFTQDFTVGSDALFTTQTRIDSGVLGETGLSAALTYRNSSRDGVLDNVNAPDHRDGGAFDDEAYRIALNWEVSDTLILDYSFNHVESEGTKTHSHTVAVSPSYLAGEVTQIDGSPILVSDGRADTIALNNNGYGTSETDLHTLSIEWQFSDRFSLRSITGLRDWSGLEIGNDLDGNDALQALTLDPITGIVDVRPIAGLFYSPLNEREQEHLSQELQLLGQLSQNVDFVFGLFYFDEEYSEYNPTSFYLSQALMGAPFGMEATNVLDYNGTSKSKAAFTQFNWRASDKLRLTAGIRYTEDEKYLEQRVASFLPPFLPLSANDTKQYDNINWNVSADYKFSDTTFGYARIATGYKAGGLTARSASTDNPFLDDFDEETLIGYELGLKNDLFDRRLRLNTNLFYTQYDDFQIDSYLAGTGGATSVIENAGEADQWGVELEYVIAPTDRLRIDGNVAWLDMDFQKYELLNRVSGELVDVADQAEFPYVSEVTAALGIQYELAELWGGQLSLRADVRYIGERAFTQVNEIPGPTPELNDYHSPFKEAITADAYTLTDVRASLDGVQTGLGELRVSAWLRNAFDEEYVTQGIDSGALGFGSVIYGDPRTFGLDLRLQF
ncbi:TonB-dependent receptor [Ferrimonas pelagia]|uniref:TonB-dependent receptor n=1 Tax=Ferrimonas pelagia TaxID=1177826 RepID=A0ABP9ENQ0_9GAMM